MKFGKLKSSQLIYIHLHDETVDSVVSRLRQPGDLFKLKETGINKILEMGDMSELPTLSQLLNEQRGGKYHIIETPIFEQLDDLVFWDGQFMVTQAGKTIPIKDHQTEDEKIRWLTRRFLQSPLIRSKEQFNDFLYWLQYQDDDGIRIQIDVLGPERKSFDYWADLEKEKIDLPVLAVCWFESTEEWGDKVEYLNVRIIEKNSFN